MRDWTRRLRVRVTFAYTLLLLALFAVLALVFCILVASNLRGAADDTLRTESRLLLAGLNVENGSVQQSADPASGAEADAAFSDLLILPDGALQGTPASVSPAIPPAAAKQLATAVRQQRTGLFTTVQVASRPVRLYASPVADARGRSSVARSVAEGRTDPPEWPQRWRSWLRW